MPMIGQTLFSPAVAWFTLEYLSWLQMIGLFAAVAVPVVLLGRVSMAGLGPVRQWVSIGIRLLVLLLLVLAIAGLRMNRSHTDLEVLFLRDVSASVQQVRTPEMADVQDAIQAYLKGVSENPNKPPADKVGVVSFRNRATIDAIPNTTLELGSGAIRDPGSGTDPAAAIQLALAAMGKDAMHRLVMFWDGNATEGDLESALALAASRGVPIDVMPLNYSIDREVLIERFVAPSWRRENEPFTVDVVLRSTSPSPVAGRLTVYRQGQPMDMDARAPGVQPSRDVRLEPGLSVQRVDVPPLAAGGVHQFRATFEPSADSSSAVDTLAQNNTAEAFTFVRGKGRLLYVDNVPDAQGRVLLDALSAEGVAVAADDVIGVDQFPSSLMQLQNFDAVVLANVPRGAGGLSEQQQQSLAAYVHEMGGGLVMIGGPDAFGAGGWQGSELEEVLPVDMEVPAQRQVAKGALVLIMHSTEMPDGNYWGEQSALKAIETLSAGDEIGVISYDWGNQNPNGGGGSQWDFPLQEKRDGVAVVNAVRQMRLGDMPSFEDAMTVALNGLGGSPGLKASNARQKHVIIISDGDPAMPTPELMAAYTAAKVSVSTVTVYPHTNDRAVLPETMRKIAETLKGKSYGPVNNDPQQLPQIFIKEATVVRRTLITEQLSPPYIPVKSAPTDSDQAVGVSIAAVRGMVLTTRKPSPQVEMPFVAGKLNDPLFAHWQAGLGRSAVFTSDATARWSGDFVASGDFGKFWSQVVRGVSRAPMSGDFEVRTAYAGGKGKVIVEALDRNNAFLNFVSMRGTVLGPDGTAVELRVDQSGPGTYEAEFDAPLQGVYAVGLGYTGKGVSGTLRSGMVVNDSPELRPLRSDEAAIRRVADATGGRVLPAFDPAAADAFRRDGLTRTASPLPLRDWLLPMLVGLLLADVASRRIAWDLAAIKRYLRLAGDRVRRITHTTRAVDSDQTLDALRQARESAADAYRPRVDPRPDTPTTDRSAKFEASTAIEGDLSDNLAGAKIAPPPPKSPQTGADKPAGTADTLSDLLAAKQRARDQMKNRDKQPPGSQ